MRTKSQDSVHKPQFLKRKDSRSGSNQGPSAYQPSALPLGHTGSLCCCVERVSKFFYNRVAFPTDLYTLVSPELCPSIDDFNSTLESLLEKHAPVCRCKVHADRLEPWHRDVRDELEAAKKHKHWAERQWIKTAPTVNKQIFNAAKRLVAMVMR